MCVRSEVSDIPSAFAAADVDPFPEMELLSAVVAEEDDDVIEWLMVKCS